MKELIKHSILSGILVGIGVVVNTMSENHYIGAMLFSLALLVIMQCGFTLYTGRIGFIKTIPLKELGIMLICNFAGVLIPTMMVATQRDTMRETMMTVAKTKFSNDYLSLFLFACLCGVMMFIAVYCKNTLITIFCIMVFILSGYEHCIADFPYLILSFSFENLAKLVCIIFGNSIGSIAIHYLAGKQK